MPDPLEVLGETLDQLSLHPLDVVAVELEPDVGRAHLAHDLEGEPRAVEEVPRALPRVQDLDEERDAGRPGERGGAAQGLHHGAAHGVGVDPGHPVPGEDVEAATAEPSGPGDRVLDGAKTVVAPPGIAQVPALAPGEVASLRIEEDEVQPVTLEFPAHPLLVHVVDEEELDGPEPRGGGSLEALEERQLVEQHGQVRRVAEHQAAAPARAAAASSRPSRRSRSADGTPSAVQPRSR